MAEEVQLTGLSVAAKTPRVVAEGVGFCWYPSIRQFSTGELMVGYSLNADSGENLVNVTGISSRPDTKFAGRRRSGRSPANTSAGNVISGSLDRSASNISRPSSRAN